MITEGPALRQACQDATIVRGVEGHAELLALPESSREVAEVVRWCHEHDLQITTRGGGTGLAAGAVPEGGLILSTERMTRIRSIDPEYWRLEAEAGVRTRTIHRVSLENGLQFPPDPGASEQSTLGGNIATNAGGPHAFKYGVTGTWVTGLEVVIPPGEIMMLGGPFRKDVSGLDLISLLIGSEGTLGIVTAAWLQLVPSPEERAVVVAFYETPANGCTAIETVMGAGIQATALEFLDPGALASCQSSFPFERPTNPGFAVIAEADGTSEEVHRLSSDLEEALSPSSAGKLLVLTEKTEVRDLWRWRDGVSLAVAARRGGKVSEDVVVPLEHFERAVAGTIEIGNSFGLEACSWGHAGDGNLHSTFMVDLENEEEMDRAKAATSELFTLVIELGGSISGEHGIGLMKSGRVADALDKSALRLQRAVNQEFDPGSLLNPGKKALSGSHGD